MFSPSVFFSVLPLCLQGHMVTRGTYSELQGSGLDFASLLKEDEDGPEEERQEVPAARCSRALSNYSMSSMSSLSSSRHSLMDGAAVASHSNNLFTFGKEFVWHLHHQSKLGTYLME